jgi:hypothetical protein
MDLFWNIFNDFSHKSLEEYFATISLDLKMGNFKPSSWKYIASLICLNVAYKFWQNIMTFILKKNYNLVN